MPTPRDEKHKQAPITDNDEVAFLVDEKLQSLIQFLFDMGFCTYNSCQDNIKNTCWIQFDLNDWITISEIAFRTGTQALYRFIEDECDVQLLSSDDGQLDENDEYWIEGDSLMWSASVRFPKKFILKFENLVRSALLEYGEKEASDSKGAEAAI